MNQKAEYETESDFSSMAYYWTCAALQQKKIVTSYKRNSLQIDANFIEILHKMGVYSEIFSDTISIYPTPVLHGIEQSMQNMPDQVPSLAVLALFADSPTRITNINHLQFKESNRIQAIAEEFRKLGATVLLTDDSILIHPLPKKPLPIKFNTHNDHRLIMAFSLIKKNFLIYNWMMKML